MSKKFAFDFSVKCANIEERNKVAKILDSTGHVSLEPWNTDECDDITLTVIVYGYEKNKAGQYSFHTHNGRTTIHITDIHEPLIRDLAAACANDTWQDGERWWNIDEMSPSVVLGMDGEKVGRRNTRRPTAKEIIEYHGFELLDDGNVVRKQPKLEDITTEPETCFKTDDGYYIHDEEVFYRVLPDYSVEKCVYKNGMRVFDKDHVLARFKDYDDARIWAWENKPKEFFVDDAGNKVYEGETYWYIDVNYMVFDATFKDRKLFLRDIKSRFKNKSDAEAWVKNNKPFEPFELSIPIKTKQDIIDLWHRLCVPDSVITSRDNTTTMRHNHSDCCSYDMFLAVNNKCVELGIKK